MVSEQVRKLELLIAVLVLMMAACFFGEMSYVKPPAGDVHPKARQPGCHRRCYLPSRCTRYAVSIPFD